jgi:hypothetical protein
MSFFEPFPPPPPPGEHRWAPPAWDRPSEGTLPAIVPVGEIVHRGDVVVVEIDHLRVYPNGFTINVVILMNPHLDPSTAGRILRGDGGPPAEHRFPRIGVRFADGRTAGREAGFPGSFDVPKDEQGIPTVPVLRMVGGGGGSGGYHYRVWVFPLPPAGPVELHVSLPSADPSESKIVIDGAEIRAAAERATIVWD